jgi:DNA-binding protein
MSDNLNTLLDELSSFSFEPTTALVPAPVTDLSEDKVTEFVLKKSGELIDASIHSINSVKDLIIQGQDPEEIASLASLINSATGAIEILNKTMLQKKKIEATKEIEQLKIEGKKQIAASTVQTPTQNITGNTITNNNTQVVLASREEIMKHILSGKTLPDPNVIEAELVQGKEPVPVKIKASDILARNS